MVAMSPRRITPEQFEARGLRCDLCYLTFGPEDGVWTYTTRSSEMEQDDPQWAICDPCHEICQHGELETLERRVVALQGRILIWKSMTTDGLGEPVQALRATVQVVRMFWRSQKSDPTWSLGIDALSQQMARTRERGYAVVGP